MSKNKLKIIIVISILCCSVHSARILGIFPTPSISHQIVFRPLMQELAKRGHMVTIVTPDPAFRGQKPMENYAEIDVEKVSYPLWNNFIELIKENLDHYLVMTELTQVITDIFEKQLNTKEFKEILHGGDQFDLVITEVWSTAALGVGVWLKAPVVQISSMPVPKNIYEYYGVPTHLTIYPELARAQMTNLTIIDKINGIITEEMYSSIFKRGVEIEMELLRKVFGDNMLEAEELWKVPELLLMNVHSIWIRNRSMPRNVVLIGGIHQNPVKDLPVDLKEYLDSSKNGIIYLSFGTNFRPNNLDPNLVQIFCEAFRQLPYDVIWKWNEETMPNKPDNVKLMTWLPQSDLLRHPKIKLFITQAGLQSSDESITAGVPLLAFPNFADQFYNAEMYQLLKIGEKMDLVSVTVASLLDNINRVINDHSYKDNIKKLNVTLYDQPQTALERAVWYVEHILRHGNAKHLRSPMVNTTYTDFFMLDVVSIVFCISVLLILCLFFILRKVLMIFESKMFRIKVNGKNE